MSSKHPTPEILASDVAAIAAVNEDLVTANKLLVQFGIVDAFGHVSARHPVNPSHFLMSKRMAPAQVTVDDIREHGSDGQLVVNTGEPLFLERFIHSEIYAARSDIHAVVHSHSSSIIAFGIVDLPLKPVCQMCGFLGTGAPVFEMRETEGDDSDLMINSSKRGKALVNVLADQNVVLMRGHGSTAVGQTIARAVYRAIYTETNAKIQSHATTLGKVNYLTEGEAATAEKLAGLQVERTWNFWKEQVAQ